MNREDHEWQSLLDQARNGDDGAFGKLLKEYLIPKLAKQLQPKLQDDDVDEVIQEIGKKLMRGKYYQQPRMAKLCDFEKVAGRIAHNERINLLARASRLRFMITPHAIEQLRLCNVSNDVLARLENLIILPVTKTEFIKLAQEAMGELFEQFQHMMFDFCRFTTPHHIFLDSFEPVERQTPLQDVIEKECNELIEETRKALSDEEKNILDWHEQGKTFDEIARLLQKPRSTAYHQYKQIIRKFLDNKKLQSFWKKEQNA